MSEVCGDCKESNEGGLLCNWYGVNYYRKTAPREILLEIIDWLQKEAKEKEGRIDTYHMPTV